MARRFEGKTVIVTGASSGIGESAARQFAAEGASVVLAARSAATLEHLASEIAAEGGVAMAVPTDVSDSSACALLLEAAQAKFGAIHVLVNNAGYNFRGPVEEAPSAELAKIIDVNLRAPVVLSRLALPYLRRSGKAAIVNVASIAGRIPLPYEATYSATKFGLRAFTFALAEELESTGITVSAVSPGPVETGFLLHDVEEVPDIVFSQPMSSAAEVAALVLDCAHDGALERVCPQISGYLATAGYLVPQLPRLLRPLLQYQGRAAKEKYLGKLRAKAGR
ncbi:MAG TPA: SDR family oxidoreductase [Candidatus Limnocylindrales bacterium]|nr:SDR family oxidoreductase [Candidatus Limnocylindrales bacterium]